MTKTNESERAVELKLPERFCADRDAEFERIRYRSGMDRSKYAFNEGARFGYEAGARATRWHRVEDGLPEEDDDFLVQYQFPYSDAGPFVSTAEFFAEGEDPAGWLIHRTSNDEAEVVAWAEIEPYIEEEQKWTP